VKKIRYLTTSIAYINGPPHIGHLYEFLAADILKRYYQLRGEEVMLLTGTDEHGVKVAEAAKAAGKAPQEWADETAAKFEALGKQFDINFDYFIRTSHPDHKKFVQEKWRQLAAAGLLEKKKYSALYCRGCEAFKQSAEIKDGQCTIHNQELEKVEEENYFFKISPFKSQISQWIDEAVYPETRRTEVRNVLESGAYDEVSVSRPRAKYGWGVEVPDDAEQIMYVWVDALFNYLSGAELSGRKIEALWPADTQIIGKDILKFHAVIWPALLLATGYELPRKLLVHGFINVEGKKLSKSTGHIVYPSELLERYGVEASRYLLFRQLNFYDDSNFSWEEFDAIYNGELANGLGNLLQRTVSLSKKFKTQGAVEAVDASGFEKPYPGLESDLPNFAGELKSAISLIAEANEWFSRQKPWEWESLDAQKKATLIDQSKLFKIAAILKPFMPETAQEIRRQLEELDPKPLFPRIGE
jgi:methionyl-tRNA synthetase